ncbi:glyoxalase/bleomycin resistance/extradiol dioxygenase family protein [Flaviaesturariibacter flavus]|uniref:Glyoxalase/bleomycin resistance/extradiol dioxygenase family protein n=1 Tax=Flaviaesturariibacter flavus TaxID=2502780 RepID=A0A4R1B454_9BACT|nr:glyoxalase/bleomycin resistance/extradiol dioxygenase family protein [Flaviaesturariibacter flavus]TCJ12701.1 glyoxalase/bleomycin resistance/extradiol dioxygenase family protein [Flaviaesturariibacter flavus]
MTTELRSIIPVLPSADIARDINWYAAHTGFTHRYSDGMYAVLQRDGLVLHLQWHADTPGDPLLGGSVIRVWVKNIRPLFDEFVQRGTVAADDFRASTPWGTNEFGFFDPNKNAVFLFEDCG